MKEVSAGLNDANEGDDEERHNLHHGADLTHPGGKVDVAVGHGPVEHLGHQTRLEGDHAHDQQGDWQHLKIKYFIFHLGVKYFSDEQ